MVCCVEMVGSKLPSRRQQRRQRDSACAVVSGRREADHILGLIVYVRSNTERSVDRLDGFILLH